MLRIGPWELVVVLVVVIVLFGPTQIPKLTKMFGEGIRNFRDGLAGKDKDAAKPADKPAEGDGKPGADA